LGAFVLGGIRVKICEHIKINGEPCGSPAVNGTVWCYFHERVHDLNCIPGSPEYVLPALEDHLSIQLFLMQIANGQTCGSITPLQANALLNLARAAMQNLKLQRACK
jgi:hypothetical protein